MFLKIIIIIRLSLHRVYLSKASQFTRYKSIHWIDSRRKSICWKSLSISRWNFSIHWFLGLLNLSIVAHLSILWKSLNISSWFLRVCCKYWCSLVLHRFTSQIVDRDISGGSFSCWVVLIYWVCGKTRVLRQNSGFLNSWYVYIKSEPSYIYVLDDYCIYIIWPCSFMIMLL